MIKAAPWQLRHATNSKNLADLEVDELLKTHAAIMEAQSTGQYGFTNITGEEPPPHCGDAKIQRTNVEQTVVDKKLQQEAMASPKANGETSAPTPSEDSPKVASSNEPPDDLPTQPNRRRSFKRAADFK